MKKIISVIIWSLALFGLYGTAGLVMDEISIGDICPKILNIPACYIILTCFILVLVAQTNFAKKIFWLYFIGAGIAWTIAATGTIGQLTGTIECPKTAGGTPMCYLSLAFFSSLIILKLLELKLKE